MVKAKEIPDLAKNSFVNCRNVRLKADAFDVMYSVLRFEKNSAPDPRFDTLFLRLRLTKVLDHFKSGEDRGSNFRDDF